MFETLVDFYTYCPATESISNLLKTYRFLFTSKDIRLPFTFSEIEKCDAIDLLFIIEEIEFYLHYVRLEDLQRFTPTYYLHRNVCLQKLHAIEFLLEIEQHPYAYDVIRSAFTIRHNDLQDLITKFNNEINDINICA